MLKTINEFQISINKQKSFITIRYKLSNHPYLRAIRSPLIFKVKEKKIDVCNPSTLNLFSFDIHSLFKDLKNKPELKNIIYSKMLILEGLDDQGEVVIESTKTGFNYLYLPN